MKKTRIGISGWTYPPWRKTFYPEDLPHRLELHYASEKFPSIEVNGTFYSLQTPTSFRKWYAETPADFVFTLKGPRFVTHIKRLKDVEKPLANYFASGILALEEKLGAILWQFPPNMVFDPERVEAFFKLLPQTFTEAARLARKHDTHLRSRAFARPKSKGRIRYAVEVRNPSFMTPAFFKLLRRYKLAFVIADSAGKFPDAEEITSDFVYMRLHGASELYVSGYSPKQLAAWARKLKKWRGTGAKSRDIFVFFDNDAKVHAPYNALALAKKIS